MIHAMLHGLFVGKDQSLLSAPTLKPLKQDEELREKYQYLRRTG
jgi:hypothetical protein